VYPQQYGGRVLSIPKEPPYIPTSLTFRGKVNEVNEGKFVLNIDFIMALKPDGLCLYETTKQDSK
jgi:hypothetical protein